MTPETKAQMTPPESYQSFDLACMCKLGRILGGHDPVTAVRQFAPTMEAAMSKAAKEVFEANNRNVSATARALGVSRNWIYKWCAPVPKNIIRLAACLVAIAITGCGGVSKVQSPKSNVSPTVAAMPALPRTLSTASSLAAPVKTNGVVTLKWSNGEPAETVIVNQTTGVVYPATTAETLTVGGLAIGSTQTFIASNSSGSSLPASAVITPDTMRLTYQTWLYLTWPGPAGTLQRTTNLVIWQDVAPIGANGSYIVTNNQGRAFYRVKL